MESPCREIMNKIDTILHHPAMEYPSEISTLDINKRALNIKLPKLPKPHNVRYLAGCMFVIEDTNSMLQSIYRINGETRGVLHGSYDVNQDFTLLHTARRQCKEQLGYTPSSFASRCIYSLDTCKEEETTFLVISLTFIIIDKGPFEFEKPQQVVWGSAQQINDDLYQCCDLKSSQQLRTICAGFNIWSQYRDQPSFFYNDLLGYFEREW